MPFAPVPLPSGELGLVVESTAGSPPAGVEPGDPGANLWTAPSPEGPWRRVRELGGPDLDDPDTTLVGLTTVYPLPGGDFVVGYGLETESGRDTRLWRYRPAGDVVHQVRLEDTGPIVTGAVAGSVGLLATRATEELVDPLWATDPSGSFEPVPTPAALSLTDRHELWRLQRIQPHTDHSLRVVWLGYVPRYPGAELAWADYDVRDNGVGAGAAVFEHDGTLWATGHLFVPDDDPEGEDDDDGEGWYASLHRLSGRPE